MDKAITIDEWVEFIDSEYLTSFICEGGSSIKFVVATDETRTDLRARLSDLCSNRKYLFSEFDGATMRLHMPQDLFFAISRQVDWILLSRCVILQLLEKRSYRTGDIDPRDAHNFISAVARLNDVEAGDILTDIRPVLATEVLRNPDLSRAFRIAMYHLCLSNWKAGGYSRDVDPLLHWVTGAVPSTSGVRHFDITTGLNRTNARYFIRSLLHWIRFANLSGTVVFLNNSRVTLHRNPKDEKRYYTRAMAIDHYEMLREIIDDIDLLPNTLVVVTPDSDFTDDQSQRGWHIYPALQTRIMDDVSANVVNPAATLVNILGDR